MTASALSPKTPSSRDGAVGPRSSSGFEARIHGVTLSDLVQMECLSGVKRAVRVVSGGNLGHLYIRSGAIVHARTRTLVGEAAALEILSWNDGTVEPVDREWPPKESIQCTWQSLLLRAAQARDERQGQQVVPLRDEGRPRDAGRIDIGETMELQATPLEIGGHVFRAEDFEVVVRIGPSGAVVQNKGASEDFADAVAYACRLTELIGGPLGIERFVAMECVFKQGRCFVVVDGCGEVFALRPGPTADSASIRELFGI